MTECCPTFLPDLHEEFLSYLSIERNYSPRTVTAYRSDFRRFLGFLESQEIEALPSTVERTVLRGYIVGMRTGGLSPTSIARRIHSLQSFWKYLLAEGHAQVDPFAQISIPKRPRTLPQVLSLEEAPRRLEAAERQSSVFNAFRDRAVLALMLFGGLRRSEILNLELRDLDMDSGTIRLTAAKGNKSRMLPLAPQATEAVSDWLELRPESAPHDRVFTSKWGAPLSKNGRTTCLARALAGAGITREGVTLHTLRHTFGTLMLRGGCDLHALQCMLGHSRLDTTAIYLHTGMTDLREAMARHPLAAFRTDYP